MSDDKEPVECAMEEVNGREAMALAGRLYDAMLPILEGPPRVTRAAAIAAATLILGAIGFKEMADELGLSAHDIGQDLSKRVNEMMIEYIARVEAKKANATPAPSSRAVN